jgi:hypothetical protein
MLTVVDTRKQLKIFVSTTAKDVVEKFAKRFDMTEQGVASRVYERFGAMPLPVQKWFVGLLEGNEGGGLQQFADLLIRDNVGGGVEPHARGGPKIDLDLIDEDGNPVGEEPDESPGRAKPRGRGKKA